jgi:hypothetical protein
MEIAKSKERVMLRILTASAAAIFVCACVSPPGGMAGMNRATDLHGYGAYSWGLAGVDRRHYDDVAIECTARTVINPVNPQTGSTFIAPVASDDASLYFNNAVIEEQARAREVRRQRQAIMDTCLTEFGFVRFGLIDEQIQTLETLPRGDPARRDFMHALGSNAEIIERQRL